MNQAPAKSLSTIEFLPTHRIETLADGLYAIVMTLLVLDLRVPELEAGASGRTLAHAIASQGRLFFSFGMTFVLAAVFWILHQRTLRLIRFLDKGTAFLALAPMLFVSLLPYSHRNSRPLSQQPNCGCSVFRQPVCHCAFHPVFVVSDEVRNSRS